MYMLLASRIMNRWRHIFDDNPPFSGAKTQVHCCVKIKPIQQQMFCPKNWKQKAQPRPSQHHWPTVFNTLPASLKRLNCKECQPEKILKRAQRNICA